MKVYELEADGMVFWSTEEADEDETVLSTEELNEQTLSNISDTDKDFIILELLKRIEE